MSEPTELLPCPFCGGEATVKTDRRWPHGCGDSPVKAYEAVCQNMDCIICGADSTYYLTEAETIAAWNTRAEQTCTVTYDFNCSNCGKQIGVVRNCEMYETCDGRQAWKSLDHEVCDVPNYCPNCGAKVIQGVDNAD